MTTQIERNFDFSGGIQTRTGWLISRPNEVDDAVNGRFNQTIGSIQRRNGYTVKSGTIQSGKRILGAHESKWQSGAKVIVGANDSGDTVTNLRIYDNGGGTWSTITLPGSIDSNTRVQMIDSLGETYVAGKSTSSNNYMNLINIMEGSPPVASITRNLLNAPASKFIAEYGGSLYAINVKIGSDIYPDRAYKSSPATGIVTFIQGNQEDVSASVDFIDNVPTMTTDSTPVGVVLASSEYSAGFEAYRAFDDDITTAWFSSASTGTLRYDFGSGNSKVITYYSLAPLRNSETVTTQAPKDWTFQGSNDGSSWTTLHTVTTAPVFSDSEKRVYTVSNTVAYRYYRINVTANQGAANLCIAEMELLTSSQGTKDLQLKVDSVRYIKTGMVFDVYKSGTNTKKFSVTIASIDKPNNAFTFTPYSLNFSTSDVNTGTDVITLSSTSNFPTGTTIKFSSTGTVPTGLTADTIYYVINVSSTTIKVATTYNNALLGVGIDISGTGSGTHNIRLSYVANDNDELWLSGRYGELCYLWNTDYPTVQTADFLRIPPGVDSDSAITAWGKTNNRLFLFTKNSTYKWDNANLVTVYEDDGCIAHETIQNISDWIIWYTAEGRVRARNDATGQDEIISRPIENNILSTVPAANYTNANAGRINNLYMLCLGTVGGSVMRLIYDFDANNWAHDQIPDNAVIQMRSDMDGKKQLYFFDDTGKMYTDNVGNNDNGKSIPFIVHFGRRNQTSEQLKNYHGVFVYGANCSGAEVQSILDNKDIRDCGMLQEGVTKVAMSGMRGQFHGRDMNLVISQNSAGDPCRIDGFATYWNQEEDKFGKPT